MRTGFCLAVVLFASAAGAAIPSTSGSAACATNKAEPERCYVTWKWTGEPKRAQWVQVLDPELKNWKAIAETASEATGKSLDPVETGKLYRVHSCDDASNAASCIDSTVFWAPLRPPVDEIPPAYVTQRGAILKISKNLPYESQLAQLNVYAMRDSFENMDMTGMPLMTPPERRWEDKDFTAFDNVLNNIYDGYQAWRLPPPPRKEEQQGDDTVQTNSPTEWIADVPAEDYKAFRARHLYGGGIEKSMIIFEPPEPKYTVTVFSDIACEHCERMMREMDAINALGVRVRFLAYPLSGPYSADGRKMTDIWCARDRKGTFKRAMLKQPIAPASCEPNTVLYHYAIAKKLGLMGSPSVLMDDGDLIGGYLTPQQLLARLQQRQAVSAKQASTTD